MYHKIRRRTYELFTPDLGGSAGRFIDWSIMLLIVGSVVAVILQTVDPLAERFELLFRWFEMFATAVFTVEYVGRIWSAVEDESFEAPITGRLSFASKPLVIIDLLAILPFYLAAVGIGADLRFLRALRLVRLLRLLKLARYSEALQGFGRVLNDKKEQLLISFGANAMLLVIASSMMYYIEHQQQPEAFSSIPATFWWGVITLTTVGYGDVTPVTPLGQFLAGIFALIGIGLFALPAAIMASGFMEVVEENDGDIQYCPHCGEEIDH